MSNQAEETDIIFDVFVRKLVAEKGYGDLEPEVEAEMRAMVLESLQRTIFSRIVADLTVEQREEFEKLLDREADSGEVDAFLSGCIDDYPGYISKILLEFRRSYLG